MVSVSNALLRVTAGVVVAIGVACSRQVRAADEEIQVYLHEINQPRQPALDLHVNAVTSGLAAPAYSGGKSSPHRVRITPEFSYGLSDHFELGVYLPRATIDNTGQLRVDGWKVGMK